MSAQSPSLADQWGNLSADERNAALQQMSDSEKQQLASTLGYGGQVAVQHPELTPTGTNKAGSPTFKGTPTNSTPGFFSRLGEAVGIPNLTSTAQARQMQSGSEFLPGHPVLNAIAGPAGMAVRAISNYGQNLYNKATEPMTPVEKADAQRHPIGQAANQAAKFIEEGVLAPVGGRAVSNIATDVGNHNLGATGGDVLGSLVNLLSLRKAAGPGAEGQLNKLTYAAGPKAAGPLEQTVGMLHDTAKATGAPTETVGHLRDLVNKTKDSINTEYGNALGPYANTKMVPTEVSQRILSLITPDMPFTAEGRADIGAIKNAATEYEKPWTLGALDSKRSRLSADLASHNAKEGVARYTAERGNTNLAIDSAINDALRDTVYPQADQLAGKPAGYFEDLKQKQSNLIRLQSLLNRRIDDLTGAQRAQQGAPLGATVRGGVYATSEGAPHGYIGNLMGLLRSASKGGPLSDANKAVQGAFSSGGPVSKTTVLSYPVRALSLNPPTPWYEPQ